MERNFEKNILTLFYKTRNRLNQGSIFFKTKLFNILNLSNIDKNENKRCLLY